MIPQNFENYGNLDPDCNYIPSTEAFMEAHKSCTSLVYFIVTGSATFILYIQVFLIQFIGILTFIEEIFIHLETIRVSD